ncbi:MerR family transcriptional regulator [Nocardia sp. CDC153]|uniref:MerR family transcriptional regulator n=1 Tax=Nocardia sp. CDC153 TaxID=3112167 RepID=UPI002DC00DCA|nr:MerR family transcriptional regulator [Nocardia sp. CDC153]MEC3955616.1 MerR family transcriptional regulator [Nocardia sp. CDC153]
MRIGELSKASGVSTPSIKYYLREGLLPKGEATGQNQAQYGDEHLRRLRLIRALIDVGGLSIAAARDVITALDSPDLGTHKILGVAQHTAARSIAFCDEQSKQDALAEVRAMLDRLGWRVGRDNPAVHAAAEVIGALRQLGHDEIAERLDDYARALEPVAELDMSVLSAHTDIDGMAETVVVGNVLGDELIAALRHLAQTDRSAEFFSAEPDFSAEPESNR